MLLKPPLIPQLLNLWDSRNEEEGPTSDNVLPFGIRPWKLEEPLESILANAPSFTNKGLRALRC